MLASLGGDLDDALKQDLPVVRDAAASFPKQTSGFMTAGGHLYQIAVTPVYVQAGRGMGLLNVLVAGYRVDQDVARGLKESTGGSDFCFLSGGKVVASTLDPGASASVQTASLKAGTVRQSKAGGAPYTMLGTPLLDVAGKPIGELRILRSSESARQRINALRRNIFMVWLIAVLVGLWLTYSLARRILKPVKELDRGADEVSRGNYDYRVPVEDPDVGTRDELGRLAAAFNAMCASIQGGAAGIDPSGADRHHRPALHVHRARSAESARGHLRRRGDADRRRAFNGTGAASGGQHLSLLAAHAATAAGTGGRGARPQLQR